MATETQHEFLGRSGTEQMVANVKTLVSDSIDSLGAVSYKTQSLTDTQKAQARANMGAADKTQAVFYIEGAGTTDTTNKVATWTGEHDDIVEYYSGLTILYKVATAGSTTTTLNINGLGAIAVVRNATTAISTACPVDGILLLTYSVDSSGTAYWKTADYDANTKNTAGTSNKVGSKMYLVGGTSQSSSGVTTYSNKNVYIGTDNGLYAYNSTSGAVEKVLTTSDSVGIASVTIEEV